MCPQTEPNVENGPGSGNVGSPPRDESGLKAPPADVFWRARILVFFPLSLSVLIECCNLIVLPPPARTFKANYLNKLFRSAFKVLPVSQTMFSLWDSKSTFKGVPRHRNNANRKDTAAHECTMQRAVAVAGAAKTSLEPAEKLFRAPINVLDVYRYVSDNIYIYI